MQTLQRTLPMTVQRPAGEGEIYDIEAVWAASQDADEPRGRPRDGWWSITSWATAVRCLRRGRAIVGVSAVEYRPGAEAAEARVALLPGERRWDQGMQLIQTSVELARAAGAADVRLYAPTGATWATAAARALGFVPVRSQYTMLRPADAPPLRPQPIAGVVIRPLRNGEELALLHALNRAWAETWNHRPITLADLVRDLHTDRDGMLVAVDRGDDQHIVATSHARFDAEHRYPEGGPYAWISNLTTDPAWRGRGLGRAMLAAAVDLLRSRGARSIALGVDGGATIPMALYESAGFRRSSSVEIWERSTHP